jgi:hypothetical protein
MLAENRGLSPIIQLLIRALYKRRLMGDPYFDPSF